MLDAQHHDFIGQTEILRLEILTKTVKGKVPEDLGRKRGIWRPLILAPKT